VERTEKGRCCEQDNFGGGLHDLLVAGRAAEGLLCVATMTRTKGEGFFVPKISRGHKGGPTAQARGGRLDVVDSAGAPSATADKGDLKVARRCRGLRKETGCLESSNACGGTANKKASGERGWGQVFDHVRSLLEFFNV
jgi:hypothetical protein